MLDSWTGTCPSTPPSLTHPLPGRDGAAASPESRPGPAPLRTHGVPAVLTVSLLYSRCPRGTQGHSQGTQGRSQGTQGRSRCPERRGRKHFPARPRHSRRGGGSALGPPLYGRGPFNVSLRSPRCFSGLLNPGRVCGQVSQHAGSWS